MKSMHCLPLKCKHYQTTILWSTPYFACDIFFLFDMPPSEKREAIGIVDSQEPIHLAAGWDQNFFWMIISL